MLDGIHSLPAKNKVDESESVMRLWTFDSTQTQASTGNRGQSLAGKTNKPPELVRGYTAQSQVAGVNGFATQVVGNITEITISTTIDTGNKEG